MEDRTDAELVLLARSGDKQAFGQLVERYQGMAVRIARRAVYDSDIARELVQEAMLQAYLSLERLRNPDRFGSWLYGIVLNVCKSYLRDSRSAISLESLYGGTRFEALPFLDVDPGPHEVAEAQELHEILLGAVNQLSPKNRAATLLFYYEQLTLREIAAVLDISVAAVKGRLFKSREQLRDSLSPVYQDVQPSIVGGKKMIKVTIGDVISQERHDEESGRSMRLYVVALFNEERTRMLPIWIGETEGRALAMGLRDVEVPRPLTYEFMAKMLDAIDATLEEVSIQSIRGDTFYATAKLRTDNGAKEVDSRPSDALSLAVRVNCPIYASEEVMEKASMEVPEEWQGKEPSVKGATDILESMSEESLPWGSKSQSSESTSEEQVEATKEKMVEQMEEMRQRLWDSIFSGEE